MKLVLGCKADQPHAVGEAEAAAFAAKHGAQCQRCSARDATNCYEVFGELAVRIVQNGFNPDGRSGVVRLTHEKRAHGKSKGGKLKCC